MMILMVAVAVILHTESRRAITTENCQKQVI